MVKATTTRGRAAGEGRGAVKYLPSAEVEAQAADSKKFTGTVVHEEILSAQTDGGMRVRRFSYEPEARSRWHVHEGEQAIYVLP
jgi:quercetin dioxygenase-like cupin family protein